MKDTPCDFLHNSIYKYYNEYEFRFLQVLLNKNTLENIKRLQQVQPMKHKKVFITSENKLYFELDD